MENCLGIVRAVRGGPVRWFVVRDDSRLIAEEIGVGRHLCARAEIRSHAHLDMIQSWQRTKYFPYLVAIGWKSGDPRVRRSGLEVRLFCYLSPARRVLSHITDIPDEKRISWLESEAEAEGGCPPSASAYLWRERIQGELNGYRHQPRHCGWRFRSQIVPSDWPRAKK